MPDPVDIKCPKCGRFLAEVEGYGRAVCAECGIEVTVKDKDARERAKLGA